MFKGREKFWAFLLLLAAIVTLAVISTQLGSDLYRSQTLNEAAQETLASKLRILELIAVGLIGIAGAAAQALFRTSETAAAMNDILQSTIDGLKNSSPINKTKVPEGATEAAEQTADAAKDEATSIKRLEEGGSDVH